MSQPSCTVIMPAFRPGGLDVTFSSLREQTVKDFEFIIVDHRYEKRHAEVMALANLSGVKTLHVPEHRRNGKWAVVASSWNTGFMLADGPVILMMPDYAYVPPDWIEKHLRYHEDRQPKIVLSPYTFHELPTIVNKQGEVVTPYRPHDSHRLPPMTTEQPGDEFGEISIFQERFALTNPVTPKWPTELQCHRCPEKGIDLTEHIYMHIYFRNESMPRSLLWRMHGMDEHLDLGKSYIDSEFGRRAQMLGIPVVIDTTNPCVILNPRTLFPTMPQGLDHRGRWGIKQCEHYAFTTNHVEAANPYEWEKMAEALRAWRTMETIPTGNLEAPDEVYYQ